jgi:Fe2+ transport system protein FeoA
MQLSFNSGAAAAPHLLRRGKNKPIRLADLLEGDSAVIESIDLPNELCHRLMELGFLPGSSVTAARSAPGGDPRVFRIDGTEIALRQETAARLIVKL